MTKAGPRWTGDVRFIPEQLDAPLRWTKPRRVFVNSMSDLFHEKVPDEWIDRVFAVMALARRHTFQVLTKRPERMLAYCSGVTFERLRAWMNRAADGGEHRPGAYNLTSIDHRSAKARFVAGDTTAYATALRVTPLPNVWLGVSVEDQATADARIPELLQTRAAIRFVSYEPALGPVDFGLGRWVRLPATVWSEIPTAYTWATPGVYRASSNPHGALSVRATNGTLLGIKPAEFERLPLLAWVICGGESGPGARPFDVAWARSAIAQCRAAGAACFVKQLGARPVERDGFHDGAEACCALHLRDRKGGAMEEWPSDLRVREFPR